jgi:hypothetical protein
VRAYLARAIDDPRESRVEDYLLRYLIERNEIDYDAHAALLYKLAGQVVARLTSYLVNDAEVENVLLRQGRPLADFVFAQMMNHYRETPLGEDDYEVSVTRGFTLLRAQAMNVPLRGSLRAGFRRRDQNENAHLRGEGAERTRRRDRQGQSRRRNEVVQDSDEARTRRRYETVDVSAHPGRPDQRQRHRGWLGREVRYVIGIYVGEDAHEQ